MDPAPSSVSFESESSTELATKSVVLSGLSTIPVGWWPTAKTPTSVSVVRSMTDTVPRPLPRKGFVSSAQFVT